MKKVLLSLVVAAAFLAPVMAEETKPAAAAAAPAVSAPAKTEAAPAKTDAAKPAKKVSMKKAHKKSAPKM